MLTWKILAPYGVRQAFNRLSLPVLMNHLPLVAYFRDNTQLSWRWSWYLSGLLTWSTSTWLLSILQKEWRVKIQLKIKNLNLWFEYLWPSTFYWSHVCLCLTDLEFFVLKRSVCNWKNRGIGPYHASERGMITWYYLTRGLESSTPLGFKLRPCSYVTVPYRFETVFVTDRSLFTLVSERFGARNGAVPFRWK